MKNFKESPEAKDFSIELNVENQQLKIILTNAETEDSDLAKTRVEVIGEIIECNESYKNVRAKVDEIRAKKVSGLRKMPNLGKEKKTDNVKSKYEYEILNNLLVRTVEEGKLLKDSGIDEKDLKDLKDLVKKKAKALILARNNTEYGAQLVAEKSQIA